MKREKHSRKIGMKREKYTRERCMRKGRVADWTQIRTESETAGETDVKRERHTSE